MAESVTVGELLVRIRADVRDLEAGLQKTQLGIQNMDTRTRPGMRSMQNAFRALAFSAAGVPGPVGRLSSMLLTFSVGGTVTMGVLAGLAAIGGVLKLMEWRAKRAADAWQQMRDRMQFVGIHEATILKAIQAITAGDPAQRIAEINVAIRTLTENLKLFQDQIVRRTGPIGLLEDVLLPGDPEKVRQALAAIRMLREEREKLLQQLRLQITPTMAVDQPRLRGLLLEGITRKMPSAEALDAMVNRWMRPFADKVRAQYEFFQEIGQSIGFALADGIYQVLSGGNFFKAVGRSLLGIGLNLFGRFAGAAIGNALFPGGGAATGALIAQKAPISPAAGMVTIDVSNMPPASNPLAATRDAQWLRFLKESILESRSLGFQGG